MQPRTLSQTGLRLWLAVAMAFITTAYVLGTMAIDLHWSDWLADDTPFAWLFPAWIWFVNTGVWYYLLPIILLVAGASIAVVVVYRFLYPNRSRFAAVVLALACFAIVYWVCNMNLPFLRNKPWGVVLSFGWSYEAPVLYDTGFCDSDQTDLPFATRMHHDDWCFASNNILAEWLNLAAAGIVAVSLSRGMIWFAQRGRDAHAPEAA